MLCPVLYTLNVIVSIKHACKEPLVRNVMNSLQEIAFIFDYSAKKLNLEQLANSREDEHRGKAKAQNAGLRDRRHCIPHCLHSKLFIVYIHTEHATLSELSSDHSDSKPGTFHAAVERFDFIVTLVAVEHAL